MKEIPLTQGKVAIVDDDDYEHLMQFKWNPNPGAHTCYAQSTKGKPMSRVIMNPPSDRVVDHIDGNGLNNQRSNLRIVTRFENSQNTRKSRVGANEQFDPEPIWEDVPQKRQKNPASFASLRIHKMIISKIGRNDAWRLSLPKDGCRALGWTPGDTITVSVVGKTMRLVKVV